MRISRSNSGELAQIFNHDIPSMNIASGNASVNYKNIEISKETKMMLEGRCSSNEYHECVADMDLDRSYINILSKTDGENLIYANVSNSENLKLFTKNIVMNALKNINRKPTDVKNIITNLFNRKIEGETVLHIAIYFNEIDVVKYILILLRTLNADASDFSNVPNNSGMTPLHFAVLQNHPEITKALLILGADPNIPDFSGLTPLHTAATRPNSDINVEILLQEKNINYEARTDLGWTPLQLAVEAGSFRAVCSFIKAGADVNDIEICQGRTVLHIAVEGGHKDIVEFLLKNTKINVNKRNFDGETALHTAEVMQGENAREICALLLKYGADPYIKNHNQPDVHEIRAENVKTEIDLEDGDIKNTGHSSFDLASKEQDILRVIFVQGKVSEEESKYKQENIDDKKKMWMSDYQEKLLATILNKTKGWKILADYLNLNCFVRKCEQSSNSALSLLKFIGLQTDISLSELESILENIGEESAVTFLQQVLSPSV